MPAGVTQAPAELGRAGLRVTQSTPSKLVEPGRPAQPCRGVGDSPGAEQAHKSPSPGWGERHHAGKAQSSLESACHTPAASSTRAAPGQPPKAPKPSPVAPPGSAPTLGCKSEGRGRARRCLVLPGPPLAGPGRCCWQHWEQLLVPTRALPGCKTKAWGPQCRTGAPQDRTHARILPHPLQPTPGLRVRVCPRQEHPRSSPHRTHPNTFTSGKGEGERRRTGTSAGGHPWHGWHPVPVSLARAAAAPRAPACCLLPLVRSPDAQAWAGPGKGPPGLAQRLCQRLQDATEEGSAGWRWPRWWLHDSGVRSPGWQGSIRGRWGHRAVGPLEEAIVPSYRCCGGTGRALRL